MSLRYVAIDTETTGLNPDQDEIIEVAAVAFDLNGVIATYNTLVRPFRLPPYRVERLTGIDAAQLDEAPRLSSITQELREFIGSSPLVGQSINFDQAFLGQAGVVAAGPAYDTFDMAQLMLPGLADYSLRGIAEHLDIEFLVRHRALADAEAARRVFLALRERMAGLPAWLLHELGRLAAAGDWALAGLLRELVGGLPRQVDSSVGLTTDLLAPPEEIARAFNGPGEDACLDVDEALSRLRAAAGLPDFFADFEARPEQEAMTAAVTGALNEKRHLIVEAGTGTGKSLAYLLPAALHALRRRERVVVSTDTIGLQEQLIEKDLPVVRALLDGTGDEPLRVASLKGRRNYLCLQRWTAARHQPPASKEEAVLRARVLVWLQQSQTGDRAELNLHGSLDSLWSKYAAENVACLQVACPFVRQGTCFLYRAKKRSEAAHILVVNHALLLSDVATGGHVLPPYSHLIVDEAHNLEDEATARFAFRAGEADLVEFLDRVGRRGSERSGIVGTLNEAMRGDGSILVPGAYLASLGSAILAAASRTRQRLAEPYRLLSRVLRDFASDDRESDGARLLVTRATRVQAVWSDVEIATENLDAALGDLVNLLDDLRTMLEAGDQGPMDQDGLVAELTDLWQVGLGLHGGLRRALLEADAGLIVWLERSRQTGELSVCSAPLAVADILRRDLFEAKETVVLTSATLSAGGSFDYLRERVGLDDADELLLGSPFDFPASTLIACPTDLPEPNQPDFVESVSELLIDACRASGGRTLVLFTSYGSLNAVYDSIKGPLEAEGILVLGHGVDGSPRQMLSALRENPRTVLLGTASFWEGVDVAGEALSLLVIARLPFAVPTDPVYQARSALYDEPFDQYALPQAVLRFRQGFGRLIRTRTDRGVLLLLDRRIRARKYGDAFLRSLPRCTLRDLASREIPSHISDWLA